jgi:hypothetical protein
MSAHPTGKQNETAPQTPQIAENASAKRPRRPIEDPTQWVKARRIAALFDCSEQAVYAGDYGLDRIRSVRLEAKRPGGRRDRRFWWPDAIAMRDRMLTEASEREQQQMSIVRLGPRRVRR